MRYITILILAFGHCTAMGQGLSSQWLLGFGGWANKGRIYFDASSYNFQIESRKMGFEGTQATICNASGNFLMSSNGVWIANANNDTMMNGSGLNPNTFTGANSNGLLLPYANIFLPLPGDSSKYILFHHTAEWDGYSYPSNEILYSIIDLTLDNGLGAVISKNDTVLKDTLIWGLAACKHANGRDWWIVAIKNNSDIIFKILLTPNGIQSITSQHLNVPSTWYNVIQPTFSSDGNKFAYTVPDTTSLNSSILLFDFDRCTGTFYNEQVVPVSTAAYLWGLAFSPSGEFVYTCTSTEIFQINTQSFNVDTVAIYDGFCYPNPPWCTTFLLMYLAANGKIYITSGSGVQHIHEMNYPDSAGTACDVQQHSINLGIWNFRSVPNHPNYYLGPVANSVCDSLGLGITNHEQGIRNFQVSPNPNNGSFQIMYLLPQNKSGVFEVYDIDGRKVYTQHLPPWSTLQQITLPGLTDGIYQCVITSDGKRAVKKVVVLKE